MTRIDFEGESRSLVSVAIGAQRGRDLALLRGYSLRANPPPPYPGRVRGGLKRWRQAGSTTCLQPSAPRWVRLRLRTLPLSASWPAPRLLQRSNGLGRALRSTRRLRSLDWLSVAKRLHRASFYAPLGGVSRSSNPPPPFSLSRRVIARGR